VASERQQFSSKYGFIISAVGSAVGLGNIWRFPYVTYDNGGGAFLVAYFIAFLTAAIPILILEYAIGTKYRGATPLSIARMNNKWEFVGWIPTIISGIIIFYYSVILSWAMNYTRFAVDKSWGEDTASFFFNEFLKMSDSPLNLGSINWPVALGLFVIWGSAYYFCSKRIDKGVEMLNKVLNPLMFLLVIIITIRGITLVGAVDGLNVLFTPDWLQLARPSVWIAAYGHVFFSCSVAMGIMITYSSYLPKKSEIVNTSFITCFTNSFVEIICAIAVFSILGYMALAQQMPVTEVAASGVGLTFIAFPVGINFMGGVGIIFGILFFICLVFAGYTSFISLLEAFSAPFIEKFNISRKKIFAITCSGGFIASLLFATGAGLVALDMVDYVVNNYGLTLVGILQAILCAWVVKNLPELQAHANAASYFKVGAWWVICVKYVVPIAIAANLLSAGWGFITEGYDGYPASALWVYCGGTVLTIIVSVIVLTKVKWRTPIDEYEKD